MLVIPAIDIRGGRCVRLLQGDPNRETVYSDDPIAMAKRFESMGASLIHVVDLDGAFEGKPVNYELITEIAAGIGIPIEVGGGIRNRETIERYLDAGIERIILGTVAVGNNADDLIDRYGRYLIAGVDAKNSRVAVEGWKQISEKSSLEFIRELHGKGLNEIIYTDISTDGMLTGPNVKAYEDILSSVKGISLIASGGVSSLDDIKNLAVMAPSGLKGCIVGKAIYDGRVDLKEAMNAVSGR